MDGNYMRLALIAACPSLICAGLFFFQVIFDDPWKIMGPIGCLGWLMKFLVLGT